MTGHKLQLTGYDDPWCEAFRGTILIVVVDRDVFEGDVLVRSVPHLTSGALDVRPVCDK